MLTSGSHHCSLVIRPLKTFLRSVNTTSSRISQLGGGGGGGGGGEGGREGEGGRGEGGRGRNRKRGKIGMQRGEVCVKEKARE